MSPTFFPVPMGMPVSAFRNEERMSMFLRKGKTAGELSVASLRRRAAWALITGSGFDGLDEIEQIVDHLRQRQEGAERSRQAEILPLRRT